MVVYAGHDVRAYILWEDNGYNSSPNDTTEKTLGANLRITQAEGSNGALRLHDPGDREASTIVPQRFAGSWSAEFTMTNGYFMRTVAGSPTSVDNADGTHTHTYDGKYGDSFQLHIGRENDNDATILKGCVPRSIQIRVSVDETVTVTMDGFYVDEDPNGTLAAQPATTEDPFTFAQADVKIGGTRVALVQEATLTLELNADPVGELGTRLSVDNSQRVRAPSIDFSKIKETGDDDHRTDLYGGAGGPQQTVDEDGITFEFDNGKAAGSGMNKLVLTLGGAFPDTYGLTGTGDPEAELTEDVNRMVRTITADYTNQTATAP